MYVAIMPSAFAVAVVVVNVAGVVVVVVVASTGVVIATSRRDHQSRPRRKRASVGGRSYDGRRIVGVIARHARM